MIDQSDAPNQKGLGSDRDVSRRQFLGFLGSLAAGNLLTACHEQEKSLISIQAGQTAARFPEKTELIMLTDRPPQLETPQFYFRQDITPNEAFFVRWHYAGIPTTVDTLAFRLNVGGHVEKPASYTLFDLQHGFAPVTIAAVNQCSGNSRSYFSPRVLGGQWLNGALGNAVWTGVRLKDILNRAGVKSGAVDVAFHGLDVPPLQSMPLFEKALSIDHALSEEVMVAYEMNGAPLPMVNGFPLRLVVPGWYATYWVKSLSNIAVLPEKFKGFWMDKAYRIPNNARAEETPEHLATDTVPINKMNVRSLIIRPDLTDVVRARPDQEVEGIAFASGAGIATVEVSVDGGATWNQAQLDNNDLGNYSFRRWRYRWSPQGPGNYTLMSRASTTAGETQVANANWNKSGYMRNVIERAEVKVI